MTRLSRLAVPGYLVCAWLVLFPLVDALIFSMPLSPTIAEWRYTMTTFMSRSLMTPALGMFVAVVLAGVLEHGKMQRFIAFLSGLATVVVLVAIGVFFVDSVGLRGVERAGVVPPFGFAWLLALAKLLVMLLILGGVTFAGRGFARERAAALKSGGGVVVGG